MTVANFVHLRVHSAYSLSEGAIHIKDLAVLCREHRMPAVAVVDSGNLFGALEFSQTMADAGVQPIVGCALAVDWLSEAAAGNAARAGHSNGAHDEVSRLVFLVQDETGYRNLIKLSSMAYLETDAGVSLNGTFDCEITFFETATITSSIDSQTTETQAVRGVFAISVMVPEEMLTLDEVWYSLAIDTNLNGLDEADLFEGRFQIASVPFSLSTQPADFFATHGGYSPDKVTAMGAADLDDLMVCPFITPPSGVVFDKMSVFFEAAAAVPVRCSIAIYDRDGNAVASSGEIILAPGSPLITEVSVSGTLLPSTLYYTGWGTNSDQGPGIRQPPLPALPTCGRVLNVVVNGIVPQSFSPATVDNSAAIFPISITLSHVE